MKIKFEFILGLVILIFFSFLFIKAFVISINTTERNHFELMASFLNIGNLEVGSNIQLKGINIGNVNNISLDDYYNVIVIMDISKQYNIPVDSEFIIRTEGLIGQSFIDVIPSKNSLYYMENDIVNKTTDAISLEEVVSNTIFNN